MTICQTCFGAGCVRCKPTRFGTGTTPPPAERKERKERALSDPTSPPKPLRRAPAGPPPPRKARPRGVCTSCGAERALRADGAVGSHASAGHPGPTDWCPGSGEPPTGRRLDPSERPDVRHRIVLPYVVSEALADRAVNERTTPAELAAQLVVQALEMG